MKGNGRATILAPNGAPATVEHVSLTADEALLLRQYKKFLAARGLREALYCNHCWEGERSDGCEAHVTNDRVFIRCRCAVRLYLGL